jgi:hypothetical protein
MLKRWWMTVAALAVAGLVAVPVAQAAKVTTDKRCYREHSSVIASLSGFAPSSPLTVKLDGATISSGQTSTDASGSFRGQTETPGLAAHTLEHRSTLAISDPTTSASATFFVTRSTGAALSGRAGKAQRRKVHFDVWGFALDGRRRQVYVHYVRPNGKLGTTVRLGHTSGSCGVLHSALRAELPAAAEPGRWVLVLDANRKLSSRTGAPRIKIAVVVHGGSR